MASEGRPGPDEIRVERTLHAPLEEVFRAFVEAEKLGRWLLPLPGSVARSAQSDARAGGGFTLELANGADVHTLRGSYLVVEAPRRLAFTLALDANDAGRIEVELAPVSAGTGVRLAHAGTWAAPERREVEQAWLRCLGRLPAACDRATERFFERLTSYPRFRSRFGGFWADLSDAPARIEGKRALGVLSAEEAELFRHWVEKGYVVLPGAVAPALVDRLSSDLERAWREGDERVWIEAFPEGEHPFFARIDPRHRNLPHKVLDFHAFSAAAREVLFVPRVRAFLEKLFERPPMAFQSLVFAIGTEQDMHQDTAYVLLRSPLEFVGCWIALEDVREGSGELQYYEGSHRIEEYLWFGRARARPYDYEDEAEFLRWMHEKPRALGLPLTRFRPKKGDVLLWHADLVHGGAERTDLAASRSSLVAHFAPVDVDPEWFGTCAHSARLEHAKNCFYCYRIRSDEERPGEGG